MHISTLKIVIVTSLLLACLSCSQQNVERSTPDTANSASPAPPPPAPPPPPPSEPTSPPPERSSADATASPSARASETQPLRDLPTAQSAGAAPVEKSSRNRPVAEPNYAIEKVYFGTDRARGVQTVKGLSFGGNRSDVQTFGICEVSIPRDHRMGRLEAPSIWHFEFRENPDKHVVLLNTQTLTSDAFFATFAAARQKDTDSILIFVHGYNVTFEDAARRTAQITYDLGFPGVPVFYSWPSRGKTAEYMFDEGSIEWAETDIESFLDSILSKARATTKVYVIGHSMGNRGLTRALASLVSKKPTLAHRLSEIVLTAPDIDAGVFQREIAPALIATGRPITLYASATDEALHASKLVHDEPRAGDAGQGLIVMKGMETVDASAVDTSFLGHSYFADTRSVISDMFDLIEHDVPASQRFGLETVKRNDDVYWKFKP